MKIEEITIFAYQTKGEALAIANNTVDDTLVAGISIISPGGNLAEISVAWVVLPVGWNEKRTKKLR